MSSRVTTAVHRYPTILPPEEADQRVEEGRYRGDIALIGDVLAIDHGTLRTENAELSRENDVFHRDRLHVELVGHRSVGQGDPAHRLVRARAPVLERTNPACSRLSGFDVA